MIYVVFNNETLQPLYRLLEGLSTWLRRCNRLRTGSQRFCNILQISENPKCRNLSKLSILFILHSLICRVLLLLLLLLCNASDLRNCTSYFGACMWVWYCRPAIGAHFHPTPQPPSVPQQLGEKAHLRTVATVLANATGDAGLQPARVGLHTRGLSVERRLVQATAVRRSHSSC